MNQLAMKSILSVSVAMFVLALSLLAQGNARPFSGRLICRSTSGPSVGYTVSLFHDGVRVGIPIATDDEGRFSVDLTSYAVPLDSLLTYSVRDRADRFMTMGVIATEASPVVIYSDATETKEIAGKLTQIGKPLQGWSLSVYQVDEKSNAFDISRTLIGATTSDEKGCFRLHVPTIGVVGPITLVCRPSPTQFDGTTLLAYKSLEYLCKSCPLDICVALNACTIATNMAGPVSVTAMARDGGGWNLGSVVVTRSHADRLLLSRPALLVCKCGSLEWMQEVMPTCEQTQVSAPANLQTTSLAITILAASTSPQSNVRVALVMSVAFHMEALPADLVRSANTNAYGQVSFDVTRNCNYCIYVPEQRDMIASKCTYSCVSEQMNEKTVCVAAAGKRMIIKSIKWELDPVEGFRNGIELSIIRLIDGHTQTVRFESLPWRTPLLMPGDYALCCRAPGYIGFARVSLGLADETINLRMSAARAIVGEVRNNAGSPLWGCLVRSREQALWPYTSCMTDSNGKFSCTVPYDMPCTIEAFPPPGHALRGNNAAISANENRSISLIINLPDDSK